MVEISIRRLLPVIETELLRHIGRKKLIKEMSDHLQQEKNYVTCTRIAREKRRFFVMIDKQVRLAQKNISMVSAVIENGMPMEEW